MSTFYGRIYQEASETNAAVVAVETHTIHKLEEGIGESLYFFIVLNIPQFLYGTM